MAQGMTARAASVPLPDQAPCVYCGLVADTIDHVPPSSIRPSLIAAGLARRYPFVEVPACRECNVLLGASHGLTVPERKRYLKRRLRSRYAKYLRVPDWNDYELGHLGPNLQRYIAAGLEKRRVAEDRLRW